MKFVYYFFWTLILLPGRLLFPSRVLNRNNIPQKRAILSCNHLSLIDPVIVGLHTRRHLHFFAKKELSKNFIMRWLVPSIGGVFVERGEADIAAIKKVLRTLKEDKVLIIFPEGRRNKDSEDMQELRAGAIMFAVKTGAPVTPVILWRRPKPFRRNFIYYGTPVSFDEYRGVKMTREQKARATVTLTQKMNEAKEELHALLKVKKPRLYARYAKKIETEKLIETEEIKKE